MTTDPSRSLAGQQAEGEYSMKRTARTFCVKCEAYVVFDALNMDGLLITARIGFGGGEYYVIADNQHRVLMLDGGFARG